MRYEKKIYIHRSESKKKGAFSKRIPKERPEATRSLHPNFNQDWKYASRINACEPPAPSSPPSVAPYSSPTPLTAERYDACNLFLLPPIFFRPSITGSLPLPLALYLFSRLAFNCVPI